MFHTVTMSLALKILQIYAKLSTRILLASKQVAALCQIVFGELLEVCSWNGAVSLLYIYNFLKCFMISKLL